MAAGSLISAAKSGDESRVLCLLGQGASLPPTYCNVATKAFLGAAKAGKADSVRCWLLLGVPCDVCSTSGSTALIKAARHGRVDTVRLLLDAGSAVNAQDNSGRTAFYECARYSNSLCRQSDYISTAELLLNAGANPALGPPLPPLWPRGRASRRVQDLAARAVDRMRPPPPPRE